MITFYNELPIQDKNTLIIETINDFPNYFKIPNDTKNLFKNPFSISQIISVYEYFELLCFEEFKKNIDPSYKEEINDEKKKKIENYFDNNPYILLNKSVIYSTIIKFISRSLLGIREDLEIGANLELFSILAIKEDCWNREISNNSKFGEEINILQQLDIKVGEVLNLYEILGGDNNLLGEDIKKEVEIREDKKIENKENKKNKNKKKAGKKSIF